MNVLRLSGSLKVLANEDTLLMFLGLRKLGNICCGHKMFLNKIRNVARAGKRGNICVRNNVSSFARAFKSLSFRRVPYKM